MGAFAGWLHHPAHTLTHHENNFLSHKGRLNSSFFRVNGKKRNLVIFFANLSEKHHLAESALHYESLSQQKSVTP